MSASTDPAQTPNTDRLATDDMVRVAVDQELCIGGGICEMLEPEVFELDSDIVISSVIGDGLLPRNRAEVVVDRCPGQAIAVVEQEQ